MNKFILISIAVILVIGVYLYIYVLPPYMQPECIPVNQVGLSPEGLLEVPECCGDASSYMNIKFNEDSGECEVTRQTYICIECGDGICDGIEDHCNCPYDCD